MKPQDEPSDDDCPVLTSEYFGYGLCGFDNKADLEQHVKRCVVKTPNHIIEFQRWHFFDGTKAGLLKLSIYPK
jgi:hypothetical protein